MSNNNYMNNDNIEIRGARENNLKNINLDLAHGSFTVVTGVSGSGKTSLAFDTLYAEGQRRYVESLSSYARLFLGRMKKPKCDAINNLPPAIAIEQKVISRNPRSTVGTSTEIYDYLRVLFARIGKTYSPVSGKEVRKHTIEDVINHISKLKTDTTICILSPITEYGDVEKLKQSLTVKLQNGYTRLYDGEEFLRIDEVLTDNSKLENIVKQPKLYLVVDRFRTADDADAVSRMRESVETAFYEGRQECTVLNTQTNEEWHFSARFEADGMSFTLPSDNFFSFNSPLGACPTCEGFGNIIGIDEKIVIPNTSLSVYEGCVQCWHGEKMKIWQDEFCRRAATDNFPIFTPYHKLTEEQRDWLWHGLPSDEHREEHDKVSIDAFFQMIKDNQYKIQYRVMMSRYRGKTQCPDCKGMRLKKETTYVKIGDKNIQQLVSMPIDELLAWFKALKLSKVEAEISKRTITEIFSRLEYLCKVGLGYLTLHRQSNTLSGGESQRINLTTCLGSSLVGSLYILDEPSIGLHSRDSQQLIGVLKDLKEEGNTVVVVDHDEDIMRAADNIVDIGPAAGTSGGQIVFQGDTKSIKKTTIKKFPDSRTISYLTGNEQIPIPENRRPTKQFISLKEVRMNNLKGFDVDIPLNCLTVVTGVSGSGKSTLVKGILYPAMKRKLDEVCDPPGEFSGMTGDYNMIAHVELVDQNPIGKSSRSNPVTYVKAFDSIRQLFAEQPLSHQMGFTPQYFSFNAEGGRCDECKGAGEITVEMQFMADLILECDVCHGQRFKKEILEVRFAGKNINDVLNMTIDEAIDFFETNNQKAIAKKLQPLKDVGLGYVKLGQSSASLSGGESQRVKLAYYIGQERQQPTLFIFDEPTTGLHFHDIKNLMKAFNSLIDRGHSVIVIEHNIDVIKCADYIIDLGPEAGRGGGEIVAIGTPEEIVKAKNSYTAKFLKEKLSQSC